ncbi:MAG: thiamine pyrophosphate-binding protein, partial [Deltaproteobacteria bacterium]|nr:thiamine pyrophosphate-binding protein [Deltaproteobacteria bacterium]
DVAKAIPQGRPQGQEALLQKAAEMLLAAEAPVILAGGGVGLSRTGEELTKLSQLLDAPIVSSIMGAASFSGDHPGFAGFIGSYGTELANSLVKSADVIFAVGTRFEEEETAIWQDGEVLAAPPSKIIHLDIDPMVIGKNYPVEVGLVGEAAVTLARLLEIVEEAAGQGPIRGERLSALARGRQEWMEKLKPDITSAKKPINPRRVLQALKDRLPPEAIMTVDCSWSRVGLLQQLGQPGPDRCYIVGGVLPIGWAAAAALGVAQGRCPARVAAVVGDGGFLMSIQCLLTAAEYNLPITWLVINNGGYNALDVLQRVYFGGRSVGSCFRKEDTGQDVSPDFAAIAAGFHLAGERIEEPDQIEAAISRAFEIEGPCVLDFVCDPEESRLIRTAPVTWSYFWSGQRKKGVSDLVG